MFDYEDRIRFYYRFQEVVGRRKNSILGIIQRIDLRLQSLLGIKRNKNTVFQKGSNWCSIKGNFDQYLLEKQIWIEDIFYDTYCCDEVFFQTVLINSKYKDNLYNLQYDDAAIGNMRLIDWGRGNPYVFSSSDYDQLISSELLFARKFQWTTNSDIVEMLEKK